MTARGAALALALLSAGCFSPAAEPTDGGDDDAGACLTEVSSDFPAVTFEFPAQPCRFTQAQALAGLTFRYAVVVNAAAAATVTTAPPPNQTCPQPKAALGGYVFERVSGGGHTYCLCDQGNCVAAQDTTGLTAGRTALSFPWDGREWQGPSDTNTPEGPAFGPGEYTFEVSATVGDASGPTHAVTGTLHFTIAP